MIITPFDGSFEALNHLLLAQKRPPNLKVHPLQAVQAIEGIIWPNLTERASEGKAGH